MTDPFPGKNPVNPLTTRQLGRIFDAAKTAAEIDKRVSLHTLRHCFATTCWSGRWTSG